MTKQEMLEQMLEQTPKSWNRKQYLESCMKCKKAYIKKVYGEWLKDKEHTTFYIDLLS